MIDVSSNDIYLVVNELINYQETITYLLIAGFAIVIMLLSVLCAYQFWKRM